MNEIEDISLSLDSFKESDIPAVPQDKFSNPSVNKFNQSPVKKHKASLFNDENEASSQNVFAESVQSTPLIPLLDENGNNSMGFVFDDRASVQGKKKGKNAHLDNGNLSSLDNSHIINIDTGSSYRGSEFAPPSKPLAQTNNLFAGSAGVENGNDGKGSELENMSDIDEDESFEVSERIAQTRNSINIVKTDRKSDFQPNKNEDRVISGGDAAAIDEFGSFGEDLKSEQGDMFDDSSVQTNMSNQDSLQGMISDDESISSTATNLSSGNSVSSSSSSRSANFGDSIMSLHTKHKDTVANLNSKHYHPHQHRSKVSMSHSHYSTQPHHRSLAHLRDFQGMRMSIHELISDHPFENIHVARSGADYSNKESVTEESAHLELNNYSIHKYHYKHEPLQPSQVLPDIKAINSSSNILVFHNHQSPSTSSAAPQNGLKITDLQSFASYDSQESEDEDMERTNLRDLVRKSNDSASGVSRASHISSSGSGELQANLHNQAMVSIHSDADIPVVVPVGAVAVVPAPLPTPFSIADSINSSSATNNTDSSLVCDIDFPPPKGTRSHQFSTNNNSSTFSSSSTTQNSASAYKGHTNTSAKVVPYSPDNTTMVSRASQGSSFQMETASSSPQPPTGFRPRKGSIGMSRHTPKPKAAAVTSGSGGGGSIVHKLSTMLNFHSKKHTAKVQPM